jgi:hypothetical protein
MAAFCNFLMPCFPGMLLYVLNYFEMVLFASVISGITFVFTFHMPYISVKMSLYSKTYSVYVLITPLSPEIAMSMSRSVPFSLPLTIISCLFQDDLSVSTS